MNFPHNMHHLYIISISAKAKQKEKLKRSTDFRNKIFTLPNLNFIMHTENLSCQKFAVFILIKFNFSSNFESLVCKVKSKK